MLLSLNGDWSLAPDPENQGRARQWWRGPTPEAQPGRVPGIIQEAFPGYHGVAWYWREFEAPANPHPQGRTLLRFWAVDYLAEVWLNDQPAGGHEGGETPFVLDVTGAIRPGAENRLAVRVLNPTNEPIDGIVLKETPHRNKVIPPFSGSSYNYGGILEPVELLQVPMARVEDLFVRADPASGRLRIQTQVRHTGANTICGSLRLSVAPAATGETLLEERRQVELPPGDTRLEANLRVEQPRLWDLHDPFLYRVTAQLHVEEPAAVDERSVRCGFRDFRVVDGYFRLNGRRIFLRSTHTGNHCPVTQVVDPPSAPDLLRRDLIYAKSCGYNMVRFISGMAHPWQLDFCDEIGLMVYEEHLAGWCLADSPRMAERFDRSTREMILRDRNHPSVTIWGMLNETHDGPVFRQAVASLPLVRSLDDSRLVLLGSGRWDDQWEIGSVSNPGSEEWEHVWGAEAPGAAPSSGQHPLLPAYRIGAGDAHLYPREPHPPEVAALIRALGQDTKPVFVSEFGIGSLMNAVRELRLYEQAGESLATDDALFLRSMSERFLTDWERFGMDGVYAFPEEMLRENQRLHSRQRLLTFDLIRSNPKLCGYNLTGMLDHALTGEGVWSFWREWKPGAFDAMADGWAPLRWCLFANPLHGYAGRPLTLEAVLANEDVLPPGELPARFRVMGPEGIAWERRSPLQLPQPGAGEDPPLAVPALKEAIELQGPAGRYEFVANIERGAAPAGGRLSFYLSDPGELPRLDRPVTLRGASPQVAEWLRRHGVECRPFAEKPGEGREVILVGDDAALAEDAAGWRALAERMARGSVAVFASPLGFRKLENGEAKPLGRGENDPGWLPLREKGRCVEFWDWLYHKECVAKAHPIFDGLAPRGIMDWDYYGPVIPRQFYTGQETPDEVIAAAFAAGYPCPGGYASGVLIGAYRFGAGRFLLNTCHVLGNLNRHPAADRLLLNMLRYASTFADGPLVALPDDFEGQLRWIGYDT